MATTNGRWREIERATETPQGEVFETYADITRAARDFGFAPSISRAEGTWRFVSCRGIGNCTKSNVVAVGRRGLRCLSPETK